VSCAIGREPTKDADIIFQLISVSEKSSIKKLNTDSSNIEQSIHNLFVPIKGKDRVYNFRAAFWGRAKFKDEPQIFYDSLIISVNSEGVISGGYTYTEGWAEPPLFYDLQKISVKELKFSSLNNISQLKLVSAVKGLGHKSSFSTGVVNSKTWKK